MRCVCALGLCSTEVITYIWVHYLINHATLEKKVRLCTVVSGLLATHDLVPILLVAGHAFYRWIMYMERMNI